MNEPTETKLRKSIRVLPTHVANQIAAGEVVERPASVLKELLENSIDAGARKIEVELINGGLSLIQVRDDGEGITHQELILSVSRHATSKIGTTEDLERIQSLGFRGEALASIASVSKFIISSKTDSQEIAYQCRVRADCEADILKTAHSTGTTVEVRDLFYNVPVRRKFLKSVKTEFERLDEVFKKVALSHYTVHFTLTHHQKQLRNYPAALSEQARFDRVQKIVGARFMQSAYQIEFEQNGLKLWGYIGGLESASRHAQNQYFFVNNRVVRDKLIVHALKQAFHSQGMSLEALHPAYVLYLELDAFEVDVNVHPTKQEVRFAQARLIHDFITHSILATLQKTELHTSSPLASSAVKTTTPLSYKPPVYFEPLREIQAQTLNLAHTQARVCIFAHYYILNVVDKLIIVDIEKAKTGIQAQANVCDTLLCPIFFAEDLISPEHRLILKKVGFGFTQNLKQEWMITQIPLEHECILNANESLIESWFK